MILKKDRKETKFEVMDNMLDIWKQITELSFRGFGKRMRKKPKIPKNFNEWSEESQNRWIANAERKLQQQEQWDMNFVNNETLVVDNICRKIIQLIDQANTMIPQTIMEFDQKRLLQDEAIGLCNNLKQELNHIADTIPCNKNFLAIQTDSIDREISLLRGWRKSFNNKLKNGVYLGARKSLGVTINHWAMSVRGQLVASFS